MKPAATISLVVVAVLTTVVIEEIRIKKLRAEILRLGSLPTDQPITITPEDILKRETPLPGRPPEKPTEFEPKPTPPAETPDPVVPEVTPPTVSSGRQVPAEYPEPLEDRIKEIALGPYSDLHYELGLSNRERAYLSDLLSERMQEQQRYSMAWIEGSPEVRKEIESEMTKALAASDEKVRAFLGDDEDFELFQLYHEMQPARSLVAQLIPLMDHEGVSLELADEQKLVVAMHEARTAVEGIDWSSAEALRAVAEGDAKERFEKEWAERTEALKVSLPEFLDENTVEVVLSGREQVKATLLESLESAIETIEGAGEE